MADSFFISRNRQCQSAEGRMDMNCIITVIYCKMDCSQNRGCSNPIFQFFAFCTAGTLGVCDVSFWTASSRLSHPCVCTVSCFPRAANKLASVHIRQKMLMMSNRQYYINFYRVTLCVSASCQPVYVCLSVCLIRVVHPNG